MTDQNWTYFSTAGTATSATAGTVVTISAPRTIELESGYHPKVRHVTLQPQPLAPTWTPTREDLGFAPLEFVIAASGVAAIYAWHRSRLRLREVRRVQRTL
jgi:hypothetical protein